MSSENYSLAKSVVLTHISPIIRQPHILKEYQKYQLLSETGVYADDLQELGAQRQKT